MKKCPHNRKSLRQVSQYVYDFLNEETGVIKSKEEVIVETYEFNDCPEGECAVWVEGYGCNYYGEYYPEEGGMIDGQ